MTLRILAIVTVLLAALPAWSHEVAQGPNGGPVVEAGAYHVELVVKDKAVDVFVSDKNSKPVPVAGFKGIAILTIGGKAQRVSLEPAEGTHLSGTSPVSVPNEVKGVVQLTTPDGKTAQGRYH